MNESTQVVCPHCDVRNRVPTARLEEAPSCGRCHKPLFSGVPLTLDGVRLTAHLEGDVPLLVDFWASWCGPCRVMAPQFEAAAPRLEPRLRLAKIDTEAEPELAQRFGIRGIPTLILFRDGREIARQSGAMDSTGIMRWVRAHLPS